MYINYYNVNGLIGSPWFSLSESHEAEAAGISYDAVDSAVDDINDDVDVLVGVSVRDSISFG